MRACLAAVCVLGSIAVASQSSQSPEAVRRAAQSRDFGIEDYFRVWRFRELALSTDGKWLAYLVDRQSLEENRTVRKVYVQELAGSLGAVSVDGLSEVSSLAFVPNTRELAYLARDQANHSQVFSWDLATGIARQRTFSDDSVVKFQFAPDGRHLAFTTRPDPDPGASLYAQFQHGSAGVRIDSDTASVFDFIRPDWSSWFDSTPATFWLASAPGAADPVAVPGDVKDFHWSSDARLLSVVYIGANITSTTNRLLRTSIGIVDASQHRFQRFATGHAPTAAVPGQNFSGAVWIPKKHGLFLLRTRETDPWVSTNFPEWTVADVSRPFDEGRLSWHPAETYVTGLSFLPFDDSHILVENTSSALHSFWVWSPQRIERSELVAGLTGTDSLMTFDGSRTRLAFVHESMDSPPEIYVRLSPGRPPQRVTHLNAAIAQKRFPTIREVSWSSKDGTKVKGWLLEPADTLSEAPRPLVTFVHGGPMHAYVNAFAHYFANWPYPFEVYTRYGISVFIPHYRGSATYGREFQSPTSMDREPVEDIVTGIQSLVAAGVADPARLGISGHSHGTWLGSLIVARTKMFRASSLADGPGNALVMYELMDGRTNREIHDVVRGANPYDAPDRYVEFSSDLHFDGVRTSSLLEGGAQSGAVLMLGLAKASKRAEAPTEFIVYPNTTHNLALPSLQKESAELNLDWFRFWLQGQEDENPAKAGQYARWRSMRSEPDQRGSFESSASARRD